MAKLKRRLDGVERREEQRWRRERRQKDEEEWKARFEHEIREKIRKEDQERKWPEYSQY